MRRDIRATQFQLALVIGLVALSALFGGCGGGTIDPPPPPTVTGANPTSGPTAGGATITVAGTNFVPGATVLVGGGPATNVVVQDANTITCTTPPGLPGAHCAVQVNTVSGLGVLLGCYYYIPPPMIDQVTPNVSSTFGGMVHTLVGSGFADNGAGPNTVTVGGAAATNVVTASDSVILFTAPAGPPGLADVVVANANGSDDDPLGYFIPIMAAQGGGDFGSWDLFAIDAATGDAHVIGPMPVGITGMDFAPDGTLYGVTAEPRGDLRDLVTIDPATAAVTTVGPLTDPATGENHMVLDVCFVGTTLHGTSISLHDRSRYPFAWFAIDTATGALTSVAQDVTPRGTGGGLAADATGTSIYLFAWSYPIYSVDVSTPTFTPASPLITGDRGGSFGGATYHLGALYAVEAVGQLGWPSQLYTVDPTAGVVTPVGPEFAERVSALASPVR